MARVLLAGEHFTSYAVEMKGFDFFSAISDHEDGQVLVDALMKGGHTVDWIRTNRVALSFPERKEELSAFDLVILSDVGSNTLLFHPQMLTRSVPHPNRLLLLRDFVRQGGGILMIGGWMSFAGIDGRARFHDTFLEEALPVRCLPYDDRIECPEGVTPVAKIPDHPILQGLPVQWPFFLGYNRVIPKENAIVVLSFENDPLLCVGECGAGRAATFMSDCAPHWGPQAFLEWEGYPAFWSNLVNWLCRKM